MTPPWVGRYLMALVSSARDRRYLLSDLEEDFELIARRDGLGRARRIGPVGPDRRLSGGDRLVFVGDVDRVADLHAHEGLTPVAGEHPLVGGVFHEVVVGASSPLVTRDWMKASKRDRSRRYATLTRSVSCVSTST